MQIPLSLQIAAVQKLVSVSQKGALVDLDEEARRICPTHPLERNPFLDAAYCADFVNGVSRRLGVEWTFGGFRENRRHLWCGSYLEKAKCFLHAGVDVNVPAGTTVWAPCEGTVCLVDDDTPELHGWGPRIGIIPSARGDVVVLLAHLGEIGVAMGAKLNPRQVAAKVGAFPLNGNWFPHLHVQIVRRDYFEQAIPASPRLLDGYYPEEQASLFEQVYLDPLAFLRSIKK